MSALILCKTNDTYKYVKYWGRAIQMTRDFNQDIFLSDFFVNKGEQYSIILCHS